MKIYNSTQVGTEGLKAIVKHAAKTCHLVTKNAVFIFRTGQWVRGKFETLKYGGYYEGYLKHERCAYGDDGRGEWKSNNLIFARPGFIWTWFSPWQDALSTAESVYLTLVHECKHAKDAQKGLHFGEYHRRWKNRPHERRAIAAKERACADLAEKPKEDLQDAILNLAIEIEGIQKRRRERWEKKVNGGKK